MDSIPNALLIPKFQTLLVKSQLEHVANIDRLRSASGQNYEPFQGSIDELVFERANELSIYFRNRSYR
jgi:hypothetical protein